MDTNIHPAFDQMISRSSKEQRLNQRSKVLWFTGLSGSGKSTIALALEKELFKKGYFVQVLDGDNIRSGMCNNLGFSLADREENIRRISELSKVMCQSGIICLNSFVSPTHNIRSLASTVIGKKDYIEIFVDASLDICESRDVKGLYKKARSGEIKGFTGIDSPYEKPKSPDIKLDSNALSVEECVAIIMTKIKPLIKYEI